MGKYRDYGHGDVFYASTVDALMETLSSSVSGLRLRVASNTSISAAASSGSGQVGIALNGLWRWRTTDATANHPGGSAGTHDIYVTCTANDFTGTGPDPDNTDYSWSLVIRTSGTPTGVAEYRKVGELDWDGSKITAIRQSVGLGDSTSTLAPTASNANQSPVAIKLASSQSAPALSVSDSSGSTLSSISATGVFTGSTASISGDVATSTLTFKSGSTTKAAFALNGNNLELTDSTNSRVTLSSGNNLQLKPGSTTGSILIGATSSEKIGFFGSAGTTQSSGWSVSNATTVKSFDADSTTIHELCDVVATMINTLKGYGLLS